MVFTRSRKRDAGDLDGTNRRTKNSSKTRADAIIDNEPSVLPPKAKRQRTTATASTTTGANAEAQTRKSRALKPVATNAIPNARVAKPTKGTVSKARATSVSDTAKPVLSRATRRSRTETKHQQYHVADDEQQQRPQQQRRQLEKQQQQRDDDEKTSSTGATHAGGDNVNTTASTTLPTNTATKSASSESFDATEAGASSRLRLLTASIYQNGVPDNIDARDAHDPLSVTDYVEDMYNHFRSKEEICSVGFTYMGRADDGMQPHINESMRCILVDWLIEVHYKFKLFPETLYLTVNILDRFLAKTEEIITKRDLQLVGVTSLLVSAKYEEMYVPELRDLTYICDGAYTEARILRMEEKILKTLDYNVTVPTPHTFLIRFLKAAHADKLMAQLACFLLDGTLLSLESLTCRWRPSQLAAAAILLARRQLGRHNWSPTLVAYSLYREEEVLPVARALLQNKHRLEENRELMALAKKYSKTKYGKVSHIVFLPLDASDEASRTSECGDESIDHSEL